MKPTTCPATPGKSRYPNEQSAQVTAERMSRIKALLVTAYWCDPARETGGCGDWHLTSGDSIAKVLYGDGPGDFADEAGFEPIDNRRGRRMAPSKAPSRGRRRRNHRRAA